MDLTRALTAKYFPHSRDELIIGRVPVSLLAQAYGTPFFVYDRAGLDRKYEALRAALPARFSIFYSIKANPNLAILRHFLSRACGFEIASGGEFLLALQAGCSPKQVVFAGPGKTEAELELVLSHGIGEIHVESFLEAKRIGEICRRLKVRARIAVRVNPTADAEGGAMRMGGRPAPFGVDEEILDEVLDEVLADAALEPCGIHLFTGTQILDHSVLIGQYRHGLSLARRVAGRLGKPLHTVDFGGGFGVPYFAHEQELNLSALREELAALFSEVEAEPAFAGTRFLVEPGRFLVAEAGVYVARVNDIKISRGKKFLIVDGGMNHHLAASGNLGQTIKRNYPVALVNKLAKSVEDTVDVVGPLCTPLDTLARGVALPRAEVGDLLGIFQSGAYARTASPLGFLSHPEPTECWVDAERHSLARLQDHKAEASAVAMLACDAAKR